MKRTLISIIALAAALNLCACGNNNTEDKNKSEEKSENSIGIEIETITEKTTKPGVVNEIALVDPFETLSLSIDNEKSSYPECLDIDVDYGSKDYSNQIEYKAQIVSSDSKKIKVELRAYPDEDALEELFVDMKYRIKIDKKEYVLSVDDVPVCLLDNSLLTDENLKRIEEMCRKVVDEKIQDSINTEIFEHDHTDDFDYDLISIYASNGRINDFISTPLDLGLGYPFYFAGNEMDIYNNRLIYLYKSKSDIYYVVTAHPVFFNEKLLEERCIVLANTAGLLMEYDSEEEAEESIKDWLDRMVVGYQEGDLVKIANPT